MTKEKEKTTEYGSLEVVNVRLVKEPSLISDTPVTSSDDAVALIKDLISQFDREVFCILNMAADGKPISMNVVSIGTLNQALVSPREVFKSSILSNAAAFIAFHCHPSGNPSPSREDAEATQTLKKAGDLLGIKLVDHLVVGCGSGKSFSFQKEGLLIGDVVKNHEEFRKGREQER